MSKINKHNSRQACKKELNEPEVLNIKEDLGSMHQKYNNQSVSSATTTATHANISKIIDRENLSQQIRNGTQRQPAQAKFSPFDPQIPQNYPKLKRLVGSLGCHTNQDQLTQMLQQLNVMEPIYKSGIERSQNSSINFRVGLREQKRDNIVHFQDPNSSKYSSQLQKKQINTKNQRNDTSYDFMTGRENREVNSKKVQGKRVQSNQNSPTKILMGVSERHQPNENKPIKFQMERYLAKQLNSQVFSDISNIHNNTCNQQEKNSTIGRSISRDIAESSNISCLPGSYTSRERKVVSSLGVRPSYSKNRLSSIDLSYSNDQPNISQSILKKSVSNAKLRSNITSLLGCEEPQIIKTISTKYQTNTVGPKPVKIMFGQKRLSQQFNQDCYLDQGPAVKTFGAPSLPKESDYQVLNNHKGKQVSSQQRHNIFYKSNISFF